MFPNYYTKLIPGDSYCFKQCFRIAQVLKLSQNADVCEIGLINDPLGPHWVGQKFKIYTNWLTGVVSTSKSLFIVFRHPFSGSGALNMEKSSIFLLYS